MSNIVGEGFPEEIVKQINVRQNKKGTFNRNTGGDPTLLVWQNSNTGWVKVVSSVDLTDERKNIFPAFAPAFLGGSSLAKKYVLFGGVTDFTGGEDKTNAREGISRITDVKDPNYIHSPRAYGIGGLEFGLQPMPGITSFSIKTETRGSLKTATIGIKCFNRTQFDIISTLYLSLGYSILIEWGNTMYYDNNEVFQPNNPYGLADEFLNGTYQWDDILPEISKKRSASCGNYDAALGKVVNFSWTINRDLTYDITLTVRTIGDVIESLKTNILSGLKTEFALKEKTSQTTTQTTEDGTTPPAPTSEQAIADFAHSTDIGKILYDLQQKLEPLAPGANGASTYAIGNDVVAIKQVYKSEKNINQYYVRFGYFLEQFQQKIVPVIKKDNGTVEKKLIKFNTDIDENIIALYNRQISADPGVCLFNTFFTYPSGGGSAFLPSGNEFRFQPDGATTKNYGKLMNVYFNMIYILNSLNDLKDEDGKIPLIDFLNIFTNGFNTATGNYNKLSPSINEDKNEIIFIDEVPLPDRNAILQAKGKSILDTFFTLFGYFPYTATNGESKAKAGIVRDISFNTTITPNLASMITIGAQANGYVTGQDSTALSSINKGLIDRVKPVIQDANEKDPKEELPPPLNVKYADQINAFQNFTAKIGSVNGAYPGWDQSAIDNFKNTNNAFAEYDQYKATADEQLANPSKPIGSPTIGFLPFDLNLTIDGLSGMKVYQKYTIDADFLPSNYPLSLEFLIKGITHTIQNNQWITTLESVAIPKNPFGMKNAQGQTYNGSPKTSGGRPVGTVAETGQPVRGNNYQPPQPSPNGKDPAPFINPGKVGAATYTSSPLAQQQKANGGVNAQLDIRNPKFLVFTGDTVNAKRFYINPKTNKPEMMLHPAAAKAWALWKTELNSAGINFTLSSAYRNYEHQTGLGKSKGVAKPGSSPHGWGGAIDFGNLYAVVNGSPDAQTNLKGRISSENYKKIATIGAKYGWYNPWRLSDVAGTDEMWHFEYWGPV
jgi:LAS superfamily LD-carboxypeptidase LdcB